MISDIFFNRPAAPWPIRRLLGEIKAATQRLCVVTAWLGDAALCEAVFKSAASRKVLIVNAPSPGERVDPALHKMATAPDVEYYPVKAPRGLMHHKFVDIDGAVTWFGSANLTIGARQNYELIVRSTGLSLVVWEEAQYLIMECLRARLLTEFAAELQAIAEACIAVTADRYPRIDTKHVVPRLADHISRRWPEQPAPTGEVMRSCLQEIARSVLTDTRMVYAEYGPDAITWVDFVMGLRFVSRYIVANV